MTIVRPIILLAALRKTLSLIVLSRIDPKVNGRRIRTLLAMCATAQRQRTSVEFLGIDLSRAFDTIRRDKLLDIPQTFRGESELRMNRFLLAGHLARAAPVNGRLSRVHNYDWHAARRQPRPQSGVVLSPVLPSVRCCPQFTWKRHFETFHHAFRRAHQPTPAYRWTSNTLTTLILSARHVRSWTRSSASRQRAWRSGRLRSTRRKPNAQVLADTRAASRNNGE